MHEHPSGPSSKEATSYIQDFSQWPVATTIQVRGRLYTLRAPWIMGILNVTPDSFYASSRVGLKEVVRQAGDMLKAGADILDVGGHSTRPGADTVPESEEVARVVPAVQAIISAFPQAIISVDTYRTKVAQRSLEAGAALLNDVTAGEADPQMPWLAADQQVPYIIMHKQGHFKTMQKNPVYKDVVLEVFDYLNQKIHDYRQMGVHDLIADPGFGFGKSLEHNYQLLRHFDYFRALGVPLLAGLSRKSMINKVLGTKAEDALNGTTVLHSIVLQKGAHILRVHDVKEARQVVQLMQYYYGAV